MGSPTYIGASHALPTTSPPNRNPAGGAGPTKRNMDEIGMIRHLARYVDNHRFPFQMANTFIYAWECDYWAMDLHGITREFEIKISRSDFFADAKKSKHRLHGDHGANYFYYVVPQYLIQPGEVDKKYGLLYIDKTGCVD